MRSLKLNFVKRRTQWPGPGCQKSTAVSYTLTDHAGFWICYYWRPEERSHFWNFTLGTLERYLAFPWSYRVELVLKRNLRVCRWKLYFMVDPVGPLLQGQIDPQRCRGGIFSIPQIIPCILTIFSAEFEPLVYRYWNLRQLRRNTVDIGNEIFAADFYN